MNKYVTNGRVTRWLLLLQEFDIIVVDKPGKDNVVADFLSRLTNNSDDSPMLRINFLMNTYLQYLLTHCGMQILLIILLQENYHTTFPLESEKIIQ
jgi:hypothetical protein